MTLTSELLLSLLISIDDKEIKKEKAWGGFHDKKKSNAQWMERQFTNQWPMVVHAHLRVRVHIYLYTCTCACTFTCIRAHVHEREKGCVWQFAITSFVFCSQIHHIGIPSMMESKQIEESNEKTNEWTKERKRKKERKKERKKKRKKETNLKKIYEIFFLNNRHDLTNKNVTINMCVN